MEFIYVFDNHDELMYFLSCICIYTITTMHGQVRNYVSAYTWIGVYASPSIIIQLTHTYTICFVEFLLFTRTDLLFM